MKPVSPSHFSNNFNKNNFNNSNKETLNQLKLPDSKPASQVSPKATSLSHIQQDTTSFNKNKTHIAGGRVNGDNTSSSKQNTQTSIKDLISEPTKQTKETQDMRNNYFRSDANIKTEQNYEKTIKQIVDEIFGSIRQEVYQGNEQQMKQVQEKATIYSKQMDQIEKDIQNSKNELKRLLNFEQYLANAIEQIGQTKKSQIEQIVQNSIQYQMNQHIQNSQQFMDDINEYKKQFDEILKGQLTYVQEAHKKYILDDQDNKLFTNRFNDQFEQLQKLIASSYIAMFEKLTNYAQQVEEKSLNIETKYFNSLRNINDEISKSIDQGIQDFKTHLNGQEQQLSKKVGIEQFKTLLEEYFQATYNKYHIQIQEAKDIFDKISGRSDFLNFYDNRFQELSKKIEREMLKKDDEKKLQLEKQKEKIEELEQKLLASQRQFNVTDHQVNKLFNNTGKNLGTHETMKGQELIESSKQIKEQYNKLLQKSEIVFNEMEKTIQKLKDENQEIRSQAEFYQKVGKNIKIKPKSLKLEELNKNKISQIQKEQGIQIQSQQKNTHDIGRKSSADSSPQFKKNNILFQNQSPASPITSSNKDSQNDIPFLPQDQQFGSLPQFPTLNVETQKQSQQKINQKLTQNSKTIQSYYISPETQNRYEEVRKGKNENIFYQQNDKNDNEGSLQDEDLAREIQEINEEQQRRRNEYQLFESNIPTHQFQLFDEKKRSSQSPQLRQSMNNQYNPSQQLISSQRNASTATFNPFQSLEKNKQEQNIAHTQPEKPYIFTLPEPPQFETTPHKQKNPQTTQFMRQDNQIIPPNVPIIQSNIPIIQQNLPIIQQSVPIIQQNLPIIQQNIPIIQQNIPAIPSAITIAQPLSLSNTPRRNVHRTYSLSPQDRSSHKKQQIIQLVPRSSQTLSPRIQNELSSQINGTALIPVLPQFITTGIPNGYIMEQQQIQQQLQQQLQLQQSIQQQQLQKQLLLEQKQILLQQQQQQNQKIEQIHLEKEQQQLIFDRQNLLNEQQQIFNQIHSIEGLQDINRQRAKSKDIIPLTENSPRIQEPVQSDQYFSLNPQYQQQRNQNISNILPIVNSLPAQVNKPNLSLLNTSINQNQHSNSNNLISADFLLNSSKKSNTISNSDIKDVFQKLENLKKKKNDIIDPRSLIPIEQRDHLQNIQKLTINPYQYNPPTEREKTNDQENQFVQPVDREQQDTSQQYSNSLSQQKQKKIKLVQAQRNQILKQQQSLINSQKQQNQLFSQSFNGNTQSNQHNQVNNMNQYTSQKNNIGSPQLFDNKSQFEEQFTFKPSLSHQFSNQRIQDLQQNKQSSSIQIGLNVKNQNNQNAIQMNDLEDFNEEDIMVHSPSNQRQSHNQKQSSMQSNNDSYFDDDDIFFYPEVNSDNSKKTASSISPINLSASNKKKRYIFKKQSTYKKTVQQQNNSPIIQQTIRPEEEVHFEKLIKRRLLYNNRTQKVKDTKLKLNKEDDGKLRDMYNKYIYDEKGNPIQFSLPAIAFLVNTNLIEII